MKQHPSRSLFSAVVAATLLSSAAPAYSQSPIPEVTINDVAGHVRFVPGEEQLTVSIQLDTAGRTDNADWFLGASTPHGFFSKTPNGWTDGIVPLRQTALAPLANAQLLSLTASALPSGQYALYFAVDTDMDGVVTWEQLYADVVEFTILDRGLPQASRVIKAATGGILSVTNTQGDTVTLEIPPNSLEEDTLISVTALNSVASSPFSKDLFPGVVLSPQGTILQQPGRLKVRLAAPIANPSAAALLLVKSSQLALPLSNRSSTSQALEGDIPHFSTVGAAEVSSEEEIDKALDAITVEVSGDTAWEENYENFKGLLEFAAQLQDIGADDKSEETLEKAASLVGNAINATQDSASNGGLDAVEALLDLAAMAQQLGDDETAASALEQANSVASADCARFLAGPAPQDLCGEYKESFLGRFELIQQLGIEECSDGTHVFSSSYLDDNLAYLEGQCSEIAGRWHITEQIDQSECVAGTGEPAIYAEIYTATITVNGTTVSFKDGIGTLNGNTLTYTHSFSDDAGRGTESGTATFDGKLMSGTSTWTHTATFDDGSTFTCRGESTYSGVKLD